MFCSQRQLESATEEMLDEDEKRVDGSPFFRPNATAWDAMRPQVQMRSVALRPLQPATDAVDRRGLTVPYLGYKTLNRRDLMV